MQLGTKKRNFGGFNRGVATFKEFKHKNPKDEINDTVWDREEHQRLIRELDRREKALELRKEELDKKEHMFNMQWKLLEHEISVFAEEKEAFKKEKRNQKYREEMEKEKSIFKSGTKNNAGIFFLGVNDELSLKKRYRDLLKMFHPDNMCGDLDAMQEINKEYARLKKKYEEL